MMINKVSALNCCSPAKSYNSQVQQNPVQQSKQAYNPSFTGNIWQSLAKLWDSVTKPRSIWK